MEVNDPVDDAGVIVVARICYGYCCAFIFVFLKKKGVNFDFNQIGKQTDSIYRIICGGGRDLVIIHSLNNYFFWLKKSSLTKIYFLLRKRRKDLN